MALIFLSAACGPVKQPEHVAAFEVPLATEQDRHEFLAILSDAAEAEGFHVDAASDVELQQTAKAIPQAEHSISAGVWADSDDDELVASVMDGHDHLGLAWIIFLKGENPPLAHRFRERAMERIKSRWPDTLSLPFNAGGITVSPSEQARLRADAEEARLVAE